jgi:hypothetical protein
VIPKLVIANGTDIGVLPRGLHHVNLREFRDCFAYNERRSWLFEGFLLACRDLREAGCGRIYVGGSFVTSKAEPGDYDACWDPVGVLPSLDPVIYDDALRHERQQKYRGDLLIGGVGDGPAGESFRFLSCDKTTGEERGMIGIKLNILEILNL